MSKSDETKLAAENPCKTAPSHLATTYLGMRTRPKTVMARVSTNSNVDPRTVNGMSPTVSLLSERFREAR